MRPRELSLTLSLFDAKTPTLPPATHTNSYALGARDVLLVEPATPYPAEQRAWVEWARALPSQGRTPRAIMATHHHPDHIGGAADIGRELGLPLWAHRETASRLDTPVARMLEDGEVLALEGPIAEAWRVLHTPGHAWGHVCLFEERTKTLVVGDMVASVGTILIAPGEGDMRLYLEQLARLDTLGATLALPAHGDPIDDPHAVFAHYIAHRKMREEKIARALATFGAAGATLEELVAAAYDDTPMHVWPIARMSLEAHLEKLIGDGRAAKSSEARYIARA